MERLTERRSGVILDGNKLREHATELYWRLKAYEDAEEQGKLIRLPCKFGDKIYHIEDEYIYEFNAEKIEIRKENGEYIYCIDSMDYRKDDFGKIAFLTVEEAEQALAKMKEV